MDDGWASVGPEGNMQYPFDHHGWELPEAKREQVHIYVPHEGAWGR